MNAMKRPIHPGLAALLMLAAIGIALGVMLSITERKPPPLPTGMGGPPKQSMYAAPPCVLAARRPTNSNESEITSCYGLNGELVMKGGERGLV
jgi:hypothetical protein